VLTRLEPRLADAIQFAKASGYLPIVTASEKNFSKLKELGAAATYSCPSRAVPSSPSCRADPALGPLILLFLVRADSDADVASKIAKDYPKLRYALDTISEGKTTITAVKAIAQAAGKGKVITLLGNQDPELKEYADSVPAEPTLLCASMLFLSVISLRACQEREADRSLSPPCSSLSPRPPSSTFSSSLGAADTVLGVPFEWPGMKFPAMPEDKRRMEEWCAKHLTGLFESGTIKPNPILPFEGGLANVSEGLDYIKAGKVRSRSLSLSLLPRALSLPLSLSRSPAALDRSSPRSRSFSSSRQQGSDEPLSLARSNRLRRSSTRSERARSRSFRL